jgi:hypothetical protein
LDCCEVDNDCLQALNGTNNGCPYYCQVPTYSNGTVAGTGVCQQVCSSGRDWTGLIAGLAAGVPAAILFLLALTALIAFLIYRYKDWLNNFIFANDVFSGSGAVTSPVHEGAVSTTSSPVYG